MSERDPDKIVRDYLRESRKLMKQVLSSRKSARAFLVRAGIADKSGKKLAPAYR